MKINKTNAARILDKLGITYTLHQSSVDLQDLSALTMAQKLGVDPAKVFKTLVLRGDKSGVLMACIPAGSELDLKAVARASGNKCVNMVHLKEIQALTGYLRGGCSPIGAKKNYPVLLDETAMLHATIYISAGLRGLQLELEPTDLKAAVQATLAPITQTTP